MRTCPRCLFSTMSLIGVLTIGAFYSGQFLFADSFDWRSVNGGYWVSNVRDQYDSKCYIYGSVASLESVYMLTRNDPSFRPDLSERQPWADGDVGGLPFTDGGDPEPVFDYFTSTGLVFETDCPMPTGSWPVTNWGSKVTKSVGNATASITTNNIKNLLKATGCVTCSLDADYDLFDSIAAVRDCGSPKSSWLPTCNHVVSIVGYYDDPLCDAGGYFVVKNSWDTWWGDGGFGYVPYGFMNVYDWVTDVCYLTGAAYRPTALATMTWKGGSGTWIAGGTNWTGTDIYGTSYPSYAWQNIETSATFNASSGTNITINGKVIAHGLTISSGAQNYVFNGVNNPSLTVTHGGITAHETVTINAPVTIGAPQSWTIDAGKTLTIGGDLHTIISHLDINGDGDTTITGAIDGGGALNAAGAAPGSITKNGAGTLHLTGAVTYSVPLIAASGAVSFEQAGTDVAYYVGNISGGANVNKSNSGTIVLTGTNSHTGWTQIYNGVMQADRGAGLANGAVVLFGGVLQSNGAVTYKDSFWNDSPNNNCLSWFGGGFAGGGGKMTVNLYNDGRAVAWTGDGNSGIAGPIQLSSTTAQYEVEIQNVLDLNAAERTIYVADNPNTDDDRAVISGVITDLQAFTTDVWSGAILKTGPGTLVLTGENENGQGDGSRGNTTIADGVLQADRMVGLSDWAGLILNGGVLQSHSGAVTYAEPLWAYGSGALRVQWISGGFSAGGGKMTVNLGGAGATINFGDADGTHGIAGILKLSSNTAHYETELQNGLNLNGGARTVQVDDNPYDSGDFATISGVISNSSGNGTLTKTGPGTLYLKGGASNTYTGTTTVAGGTLVLAKTGNMKAIQGDILMSEPGDGSSTFLRLEGNNEIASTSTITFNTPVAWSHLDLNGHSQILAGIESDSWAAIEGLWDNTGLSANSTLMINNSANCTFRGVIRNAYTGTGTGRVFLTKTGSGTLVLTHNDNSYTGGTTVSGGILQIGEGGNYGVLPPGGSVVVNSAGTLFFNRSDAYAYSGTITGLGTVKIAQGSNGVSLGTGYNTSLTGFSGTTILQSGAAYLRSVNGFGSGGVEIGNGASCSLWTSATTTFTNPFTLNGIGGTIGGYAKPALYGDGGSGTYTLSGQITLNATSDIGNYAGNGVMTLSGQITGSGGLVLGKLAPTLADEYGPIKISGSLGNNYSGGTTINRGAVYLQKTGGALALPGNVTLSTATVSPTGSTFLILNASNQIAPSAVMTFAPANLSYYAYFELLGNDQTLAGISDATGHGIIENSEFESGVNATGTLTINNSTDCAYNGYIRNGAFASGGASTGLLALVKSGTGKLTLTGGFCSDYTGGLTVNAGILDYSGATTLPGTPVAYPSGPTGPTSPAAMTPCPYTITGGILNIGALSASIGAFQMTGGTVNGSGILTSNTAYDVQAGLINAVLAGGVGLNKTGSGTAILTKNNPLLGMTNIMAGTLQLGNGGAGGGVAGNITDNAALIFNRADSFTYSGVLYGSGALEKKGAGTMTLTSNNPFSGMTTVTTGILQLGNGGAGGGLAGNITNSTSLIFNHADNFTYSGVLYGSGILEKKGVGTMTLTSNNPFSGTTTITAGALQLGDGGAGGGLAGNITNYTSLIFNRSDNFDYNGVLYGAGALEKKGVGTMTLTKNNPFSGTTTITAGTLQLGNGGAGGGLAGNITDNAALIFNRSDNFTYGGLLGGGGDFTKQGAGKLTLTGDNSFSGSVVIGDGTLALAGGGQLSTSILNNAVLEISDGVASHTVGAITGTGTTQVLGTGQLISPSITQGTLIIGGSAAGSGAQPVPEPCTLLLLSIAGLAILKAVLRRK